MKFCASTDIISTPLVTFEMALSCYSEACNRTHHIRVLLTDNNQRGRQKRRAESGRRSYKLLLVFDERRPHRVERIHLFAAQQTVASVLGCTRHRTHSITQTHHMRLNVKFKNTMQSIPYFLVAACARAAAARNSAHPTHRVRRKR